jgi:D-arabinose 5-phosphate isomerase GutQ
MQRTAHLTEVGAHMGDLDSSESADTALLKMARELINQEAAGLTVLASQIDESLLAAARLVRAATGKVVCAGVGTNGPIARRLAHLLSTTGTPALFLHPVDALHGSLGAIASGDVVIAISKGGKSAELNEFASRAKGRGAHMVVLTVAPDSPLTALSDLAVVLPDIPQADPGGIVAMGSSLITAAWGDALALVAMQVSGYSWSQVLESHPLGAVGQLSAPNDAQPHPTGSGGEVS